MTPDRYSTRRARQATKASVRIKRTTLVFQGLLVLAMVVAIVATVVGMRSSEGVDTGSPDAPPPAVFVSPAD